MKKLTNYTFSHKKFQYAVQSTENYYISFNTDVKDKTSITIKAVTESKK